MPPSVALVIPARWGSTRFPGKILHPIAGKPLVRHVWERCLRARGISRVIVATDNARIMTAVRSFGAEAVMTSPDHPSGTDRIAEVVSRLRGISHVINVQGDEPLIDPGLIEHLAAALLKDSSLAMITAATPFTDPGETADPNCVKVVTDMKGNALYFSRSPLPYHRDHEDAKSAVNPLLHLGIYGYRRDILRRLVRLAPTPLERCEKLEQLRALEHGIQIRVVLTQHRGIGVDSPADVPRVEKLLREGEEGKGGASPPRRGARGNGTKPRRPSR